ncbi:acyl-CoA dehydrogenase family protein [Haloterrigena alkaliphila]|uniref:acyl-CoA dehydrogenase family protein n=1 Tax=Haloterrigena alkaliphila TaxID=2816475 RepID=UPI001CFF8757|nr:acyl-CoA dehydrogenase family protein [Haloterrigena alkaliphila]UHQ95185.1 acyl-CoA dehydrogenase family protein [Haloterrigena alkaliphila]
MSTPSTESGVAFDTDDETQLILESLDQFIEQEVEPLEAEHDDILANPRAGHEENGYLTDDYLELIETVRKKSADAGFYAMNMPEDVGGSDVSFVTWYRAITHVFSKGRGLNRHVLAGPEGPKPLLLLADDEQRSEYVEPAVRGEKSTAFAQTEPVAGSDSPAMQTTAVRDGDEWVLNGTKQWITNAPYADFAQVFARTSSREEAGRYGGITCFLVESDEWELGSLNNTPAEVGQQAELRFDDVRLPDDRVLGEVGTAFYEAMDFLSVGRLELGAQAVGLAEYVLDRSTEYAREREAFGQEIGSFQQISSKVARGRAKQYAADSAGLRCAWKMDRDDSVVEDVSIFNWFATQTYWDAADSAVQIHGGNGLSEDYGFMDHLNYARLLRIVEGTDELQLNTIAKQNGLLQ